jgi:photosystem II stability/assembly factor-like uncharacterized protein
MNMPNLKKIIPIWFLIVNFQSTTFSQNSDLSNTSSSEFLETLFTSEKTFAQITNEAELHFRNKYPDLMSSQHCVGIHRDGDYVKYKRWKSFWENHLTEEGYLGDFTGTTNNSRGLDETNACNGDEYIVNWTNLNYTSNMGWQIDQGRTSSMAFHPTDVNTFYVGAAFGGLWKTTDGGSSYSILNDDLPLSAISGIAIDPLNPDNIAISLSDIVWYGPSSIGIYLSNDGGATFSPSALTWEISEGKKVYYMDQDPSNGNNLIIATSIGLFKTSDFFNTTTLVQSGNMRHVTYSFSNSDLVFAGGSNGQFYRSSDGGDSFTLISDFGNGQVRIAVPLISNSSNVVATNGTYLQKSIDNGLTFSTENLPEDNMVVEFAPQSETILNVGNFEVYKSTDFGASFNAASQWLGNGGLPFIHVDQRNVFVNPLNTDHVYFCNDGGIFRFNNTTNEFVNLSGGLIITQYYDIAVSQSNEFVLGGGSQDNGNIFRESDGTWNCYAQTGDGMGQEIDPTDFSTRYWSYQNGALRRWQNNSNSGIAPPGKDGNGDWETPFKLDPNNSDRLIVAYDSVYASNDQGDSWTAVGGSVTTGNLHQLAISASNSNKIYVSRNDIVYSNDGTASNWTSHTTPFSQKITDLEVDPLNEDIIYISYGGYIDGKKIYKSEDGGINWTNITLNLPNLPFLSLELYENTAGGIFVGTYGAVYYMDNSTSEWRKFGCIPNTAVNDIEIQYLTDKIYIGTHGRGIFEGDIDFNVASTSEDSDLRSQTVANVNLYPNPARDYIYLNTKMGTFENLSITVMDLSGRVVTTPYELTEMGEIKINTSSLKSGNYLIQMLLDSNEIEKFKFTKI